MVAHIEGFPGLDAHLVAGALVELGLGFEMPIWSEMKIAVGVKYS